MSGLSFIKSINTGSRNDHLISSNINRYLKRNSTRNSKNSTITHLIINPKEEENIKLTDNGNSNIVDNQANSLNLTLGNAQNETKSVTNIKKENKKARYCKLLIKFMFSNVGLIIGLFSYSSIGALMFQLLEQHEELRICEEGKGRFTKELKYFREEIKRYIIFNASSDFDSYLNLTQINKQRNKENFFLRYLENTNLTQSDFSINPNYYDTSETDNNIINTTLYYGVNLLLLEFRNKIFEIETSTKYVGQDCILDSKWTFFSSFLFTCTLISTVGYGNVAPITWEGRIVCMCYSLIGIPIFVLCLANLSGSLSKIFTFVYMKIDSFNPITKYKIRKRQERKKKKSLQQFSSSLISRKSEQPSNLINLDDFGNQDQRFITHDGISVTARSDISSNIFLKELDEYVDEIDSIHDSDDNEEDEDDDEYEYLRNEVPIYIAIIIIIFYGFGGAYLFQFFEGWTIKQGIYYVFVTLTTTGFGDLVPGQRLKDKHSGYKMFCVCIYMLFGIAVIGMCGVSVKQSVKRNFVYLKKKFKKLFQIDCRKKASNKKVNILQRLAEREKERKEILNRIKLLEKYENQLALNSRRKNKISNN